ncbi:formyl-CoA transferase [Nocardia nova]|uniref:Formyl-CoA transferase n=1 Tax=Nocardia nova TaxID=37330 RepID=A0A2S6AGT0_9NOCA|nr:CaiB/BaiF CoA-transferase family protein [Nocardia nova]PPJ21618.1 formyl-CoA transferase [Nocardia nova]PPJ33948.1 formyl-CoA transferase [Nocardia nova]
MDPILHGVKVVELAAWTFVPSAGAVLADWGADVIKIEHPETGDPQRGLVNSGMVASGGGVNHFIEQPNRGKRSIGLDVANPQGREVLYQLLEKADVFATNLLPDSQRRLGIDLESVRARNPKIIYARGHGYGSRGPEAERGGFDLAAYWARGGIGDALAAGDGSYPPVQRPAFGDVVGGFAIASGIVGALYKRERTGEPSVVDVSLLGTAIWQLGPDVVGAGATGAVIPKFDLEEMPNPLAGLYRTQDNRFIALVLLQADRFWGELCKRIDRSDLISDERFSDAKVRFVNRRECVAELRRTFESQPLEHWRGRLEGFDGVWDVFQSALEIHDDPQVAANGYLPKVTDAHGNTFALAANPVQFDGRPPTLSPAPGHGEHTDEILQELGLDWDRIIELKTDSAVL